ncbi:hypothetical protein B0A48_03893 [Cryoendolithus antarcticus]|uniref:Metallo-beta-lactamase domain-containing protein n=1 Tax=Cryoendolithus antarcticus TaxID=1507870 RepID=A0A1V8TGU7_9PEZI|nr:hypothetical protein B0A48_03893 [Cryoendolithus antarcticus]
MSEEEKDSFLEHDDGPAKVAPAERRSKTLSYLRIGGEALLVLLVVVLLFQSAHQRQHSEDDRHTPVPTWSRKPVPFVQNFTLLNEDMFADADTTAHTLHQWIPLSSDARGYVSMPDWDSWSDLKEPYTVRLNRMEEGPGYMISMFHQLHCLSYLVQHFQSGYGGVNLTQEVAHHAAHCFDYIRQAIICAGDTTLEGKTELGAGWGTSHQDKEFPVRRPEFLPSRESKSLRATWLGHACYYVEFPGGLRALFDPVFEDRCSPFSFMGPKRYTEAPCMIEDIPLIDVVIISHSHYDHLSHPTILKIAKGHPNVHFFVPLGNKAWFHKCGVKTENVTELDWWEERDIKLSDTSSRATTTSHESSVSKSVSSGSDPFGDPSIHATISCLPSQHTSARTPFDKSHTLWASWSITSGGKKLWFGGDTGYRKVPELPADVFDYGPEFDHLPMCPVFKEIGELRGPFDLGLIPIGAYDPRFVMSAMHANPYDSVNIFVDTKCNRAMGIHWGTWVLTEEDVLEPPRVLKKALEWKGLDEGVFGTCDIGESREF